MCLPAGHTQMAAAAGLWQSTKYLSVPPLEEAETPGEAERRQQAFAPPVELLPQISQHSSDRHAIQKLEGLHKGRFSIIGHVGGGAETGLVGFFCFLACMTRHVMEQVMGVMIEIGGGTYQQRRRCESEKYSGSHGAKECDDDAIKQRLMNVECDDDAIKQRLMNVSLTEIS